jgi:RHS repeat-associated protein
LNQPNDTFAYDAAGNRVGPGIVTGTHNRLLADAQATYQYDDEGNLISKVVTATGEVTDYSYDHRNRMIGATVRTAGGVIVNDLSYRYDIINRRIARTVNRQTLYTSFNGENVCSDYNATGNVVARYLLGDEIDNLIARWRANDDVAWYLADDIGTVRDLISSSGDTVLYHAEYNDFGLIIDQYNVSGGDRFSYTGREFEPELNLYYFRARFYNSVSGKFVSEDQLGMESGDKNFYSYVSNSPHNGTDPTGENLTERTMKLRMTLLMKKMAKCLSLTIGTKFTEGAVYLHLTSYELPSKVFTHGVKVGETGQEVKRRLAQLRTVIKKLIVLSMPTGGGGYSESDRKQVERFIKNKLKDIFANTNVKVLNKKSSDRLQRQIYYEKAKRMQVVFVRSSVL